MSSLAATTAARMGAADIMVANRTADRAGRLAAAVGGSAADLSDLAAPIAGADLVISCTGASGIVISSDLVTEALARRGQPGRPLVLLDLAMPRDVDPAVAGLPGVHLVSLDMLGDRPAAAGDAPELADLATRDADVEAVRAIVAEEFAARVSAVHAARVAPTVVALRAKAAMVVDAELARLAGAARRSSHARRGRTGHAPGRGQVAARTDRAGQGAGRVPRRRRLRGRAAGLVRSRPGRGRRGHAG